MIAKRTMESARGRRSVQKETSCLTAVQAKVVYVAASLQVQVSCWMEIMADSSWRHRVCEKVEKYNYQLLIPSKSVRKAKLI